jgi:hypothetical protein
VIELDSGGSYSLINLTFYISSTEKDSSW